MKRKTFFTALSIAIAGTWLVLVGVLVVRNVPQVPGMTDAGLLSLSEPQREWMEIYLKNDKVGYSTNSLTPVENGYVVLDEIFLRLNLMGQINEVRTVTRAVLDGNFFLERFTFWIYSGAVTFQVSGVVDGEILEVETGSGDGRSVHRIPLKARPMLGAGIGHFFKGRTIRIGDTFNFPIFDPSTMAQTSMKITVAASDAVEIRGVSHQGYRLEADFWGRALHFWIDRQGVVLRQEGLMGLTMVKSSAAAAPYGLDVGGGPDYYDIAAVSPRGRVKDPHLVSSLTARLSGVQAAGAAEDHPFDLNCPRQSYNPEGGILEIRRERVPAPYPYRLPYRGEEPEMAGYVVPEPGVESDHEAVRNAARRVTGQTEDPVEAAERLLNWVYLNVEKRPVLSIPSALEVLETMTGDCNEHAVLLAALMRAVGIPSRIVVGLVYARDRFYYHAWNEAFLGHWVSMDATLGQMPADATHITLIRGGLDRQAAIIRLMGEIGIEILDYR